MRSWRFVACALAAFAALNGAAGLKASAEPMLTNVQGDVRVDKGNGFRKVSNGVALRPGDQIMVSGRGGADLFYDVDCQITLEPGAELTISDVSPCNKTTTMGKPYGSLALGAGAIGVGVGLAISLGGGNDRAVSP